MIGILVELILSWLLLWFVCRKHLSVLGFSLSKSRMQNFAAGFFLAAFCCILWQMMITAAVHNSWSLNKQVTAKGLAKASWWTLQSVLYEELIFRGALLYIAMRKIGAVKACILSAVCFGVYHWFSFNAWNNPVQMTFIFLMTAIIGFVFALAFTQTQSLYLPIALHFGWNLCNAVVFSNGPLGAQLLIKANENYPQGTVSLLIFLFQVFALPLLVLWYLKRSSKSRNAAVRPEQPVATALPVE